MMMITLSRYVSPENLTLGGMGYWTVSERESSPLVQGEKGIRGMPEELGGVKDRAQEVHAALLEEDLTVDVGR